MNANLAIRFLFLTGFVVMPCRLGAQENLKHTLPDDAGKAWAEVAEVHQALRAPSDWRSRQPTAEELSTFQKQIWQKAELFANKAEEFIERFPTNENIGDARITVVHTLTQAVAAGDTNAEQRVARYVARVLADKSIPEDDRAGVLLYAGNTVFMKKVGMRYFTEGLSKMQDEFEAASIEGTRAALKQFPTNSMLYTMLVSFAQRDKGERQRELASEILDAPDSPPAAKTLAKHILKGTKPYEVGKPLDIQFTALDGREIDLTKMRGKVVLVEFWSTSCGPCVAGMPEVKEVYGKLHERGFEVVAISLDEKESVLRRFVKEKELPWPQHFDGKGWENRFALQYGIFGIPTMWLVDKRGNLRVTQARFDLERQVTSLLGEETLK